MSLLGVDLGTSGVRAACYDARGRLLAAHSVPLMLTRSGGGIVETDAEAVLGAVEEAITAVVAEQTVLNDSVTALSFSVQGEAVVPVDVEGKALAAAPVSMDRRGVRAASAIGRRLDGIRVQQITGQPLHPMFSIHKIARGGEGWSDSRLASYRCLDAFVAARLGADAASDYSMAARTGAFDVGTLRWSEQILGEASLVAGREITSKHLPKVVPSGTVIGSISAAAAERTRLAPGTPIVAGLHDQAASFIGAGGRVGSTSVFALGSSDCLTVVTATRPEGLEGTGFASYPIGDSHWVTLAGTAAGGWALEWLAALVGGDVAALFKRPAEQPPALLVLPYFAGSGTLDNDPAARGVIAGLTLSTSREELGRAFLESTGFELAKIIDALAGTGVEVGDIVTVGSGATNRVALDIRASAAGRPLAPSDDYASARGAALIAGLGIGLFEDFDSLPLAELGTPSLPEPALGGWYAEQRAAFRELYIATLKTTHTLTRKEENTE